MLFILSDSDTENLVDGCSSLIVLGSLGLIIVVPYLPGVLICICSYPAFNAIRQLHDLGHFPRRLEVHYHSIM
jgi:hypothetical protein